MAAGAHSDYGMLTLLKTDDAPGLQIYSHGGWIDVPPKDGAFIINLGDMLERQVRPLTSKLVMISGQNRHFERLCMQLSHEW